MAESELAIIEKGKTIALTEKIVGQTYPLNGHRKYWRIIRDGKLSIFITFSKPSQLFYDIDPDDLKKWLTYPKAFAIFVMGEHTNALVIPAKQLQRLIGQLPPKGNGEIKLHIEHHSNGYEFREVPGVNLSKFYNAYSQISTKTKTKNIVTISNSDLKSARFEEEYFEGKKGQRLTNYYERNPKLRSAAILAHGLKCMACKFDFEKVYGKHGIGFIEVHHIRPVSSLKEKSAVNPNTDMIVVCANCHRIIHRRRDRALSLAELKKILRRDKPNNI